MGFICFRPLCWLILLGSSAHTFVAGCTAVLVAREATVDGSLITTHNNDCMECDVRIARTPAKEHPPGTEKTVYRYKSDYPHMVNDARSDVWKPKNLDEELYQKSYWSSKDYMNSLTLGMIPEVEKTYAIVEGVFGILNEVGLGIGESTCAAVWYGKPPRECPECEGPLVDIAFLTLLALERCKTARCAIETIGGLGESLGYYAVEQTQGGGGETLTIIDTQEAWMFHILPDEQGSGAVWAAQRVPDDHVSACSNAFVIRNIEPDNPDFLYSSNVFSAASNAGLWSPDSGELLDFAKVYGAVEKAYSEMITRRQWRVFDIVAPSLKLPYENDYLGDGLPFSVKVDRKLTVKDIMNIKRDYYQGTKFDLSKGVAAGPYGDPRRFDGSINQPWNEDNLTLAEERSGGFERAISIQRTAYSTVIVSRESASSLFSSVLWVAQYAPHMGVYVPIYVGAGDNAVPSALSIGSLWRFDNSSTYWRSCLIGNWAAHFFRYTYPDIQKVQNMLEDRAFDDQRIAEAKAQEYLEAGDRGAANEVLAQFSSDHCDDFVYAYTKLFNIMVARFHDGFNLADQSALTPIDMRRLFYPKWWLKVAGYWSKFDKPPDYVPFGSSATTPDTETTVGAKEEDDGDDDDDFIGDVDDDVKYNVKVDNDYPTSPEEPPEEPPIESYFYSEHTEGWSRNFIGYFLVSLVTGTVGYMMGSNSKQKTRTPVIPPPVIRPNFTVAGEGRALNLELYNKYGGNDHSDVSVLLPGQAPHPKFIKRGMKPKKQASRREVDEV